jgi:hypothetical protein
MFSVAIMRCSKTEGTRLLGLVEIGKGEVISAVEQKQCTCSGMDEMWKPPHLLIDICVKLDKVNPDGPALEMTAGFSLSKSSREPSHFYDSDIGNQSEISMYHT